MFRAFSNISIHVARARFGYPSPAKVNSSHPYRLLKGSPFRNGPPRVPKAVERQSNPSIAGALRYQQVPAMPRWKRFMDIFGSLLGLVVLSPLFLVVGIFIKVASPGPVFFCQQRFGYLGRPFAIWKFRTMAVGTDTRIHEQHVRDLLQGSKPLHKLDREERLIPFGKWLRKLCIDELPQLFNVLGGSMSLVGPRPDVLPKKHYPLWQQKRFCVHPGITGLWQVSGKNQTTHERMVHLDIAYAFRRSPLMDIKILLRTLPVIVGQLTKKSAS